MATYQTLAKGVLAAALILGQAGCSIVHDGFNYIKKPFVSEDVSKRVAEQKTVPIKAPSDTYLDNFIEVPPEKMLYVNTDKKHYWMRKPLGVGEAELVELAKKSGGLSKTEESFFYDDKAQRWLEIGIEEKLDEVRLDFGSMSFDIPSSYIFHTHPNRSSDPAQWARLTRAEKQNIVCDVIPSETDCKTFYRQGGKNWLVATKLGIVECWNKGNDYFENMEGKGRSIAEKEKKIMMEKQTDEEEIGRRYNRTGLYEFIEKNVENRRSAEEAVNAVFGYMNRTFDGRIFFALRRPKTEKDVHVEKK